MTVEFPNVIVVEHPLLRHKLAQMRNRATDAERFRRLAREMSLLLAYEVMRDLALEPFPVETPLESMQGERIAAPGPCFVSILRAGNGILDGMLDLLPSARVGHVGLARDKATLQPVEYYLKLPDGLKGNLTIVVDPMLATGRSAAAAIARVKQAGADNVRFVSLLAAPEGLRFLTAAHPDVIVFTAAIDRELDSHGYIRPGLGDAGDRIYGTP